MYNRRIIFEEKTGRKDNEMERVQGFPLPLGVNEIEGRTNFAAAVPEGADCRLLLYKAGETVPEITYEMPEDQAVGMVRFLSLDQWCPKEYEYNYEIDGEVTVDPYAKGIVGREEFNGMKPLGGHDVRAKVKIPAYDWEGDRQLFIPWNDVAAYSLHVRGFTKDSYSKVRHKGTFSGIVEKIPYLSELGINQIQCMPVYDFLESKQYVNYWGYGPGYYFAPKAAYAAGEDPSTELKDMVKACHRAGIEVVLDFPFCDDVKMLMALECLRYYMWEYHIDGFILDPSKVRIEDIKADPILKKIKIMQKRTDFQDVMRRFLKGDEGMVEGVIWWMRKHSKEDGVFNYMTSHNGFTLNDVVSYDGKHNELNGENNHDGPEYNFSWNCGAEGPSRKKAVIALRERQMKNAFLLLLLAQGTPSILAGDEFANSQKGNNNVYCQDNETGWINWRKLSRETELFCFVKELLAFRKSHPILHPESELLGIDRMCCGTPDVSYHGENAWRVPTEIASRQLGIYYCGEFAGDDDCFIAYNMHWIPHTFALPALKKGKTWHKVLTTDSGILEEPEPVKGKKKVEVDERTIVVFIGK